MTVRAFFIEMSSMYAPHMGRILQDHYDWEILYWTATRRFEYPIRDISSEIIYHEKNMAIRGISVAEFSEDQLNALDHPFLKSLAYEETVLMKMFDRMELLARFPHSERIRLYHTYLRYWNHVIDKLRPNLYVTFITPHQCYDYILYNLFRHRNIPTIVLTAMNEFPGYTFAMKDYEEGIHKLAEQYLAQQKQVKDHSQLSENAVAYLDRVRSDYEQAKPHQMRIKIKNPPKKTIQDRTLSTIKHILNVREYPRIFQEATGFIRDWDVQNRFKTFGQTIENGNVGKYQWLLNARILEPQRMHRLKQHYEKLAKHPDLSKPYIYVPLQFQPEQKSLPMSGSYVYQLLMIDLLLEYLPDGWILYVKEHPHIFSLQLENKRARDRRDRSPILYNDIVQRPNVELVKGNSSAFDLIDNANAVATVGGTSGWEAVIRGVPSLVFGYVWYKDCEGVFQCMTKDQTQKALDAITTGYDVDSAKINAFMNTLEEVGHKAWLVDASPSADHTHEGRTRNAEKMANFLNDCVFGFSNTSE